jgi:hypothetical protein
MHGGNERSEVRLMVGRGQERSRLERELLAATYDELLAVSLAKRDSSSITDIDMSVGSGGLTSEASRVRTYLCHSQ